MSDNELPQNAPWRGGVPEHMRSIMSRIDRLFDVARPESVFTEPIVADGRTVIPAAEVWLLAAVGGGGGSGPSEPGDTLSEVGNESIGAGAGSGGLAHARPVAVIIIDRDGVRVEPVVDATKIALTALTVLGGMLFALSRIWWKSRRL